MKVVLTNGCFDGLHPGHKYLIREARKLGDRLVVAVNTDESVRALKGPGRPINTLMTRIDALSSVQEVSEVVPFDDLEALIFLLKPDIIVKGDDYREDEVVGRDMAEVVIIPRLDGYSTTELSKHAIKKAHV